MISDSVKKEIVGEASHNEECKPSKSHISRGESNDSKPPASANAQNGSVPVQPAKKKQREDFEFGKIIGEGSYSTVVLAKEKSSGKQFAFKILEKRHIIREKKVAYVSREKEVLAMTNHPFIVRLYCTFQDKDNLCGFIGSMPICYGINDPPQDYGLSYAKKGELLPYINKLGSFDEKCTQFYSAELILALEYLHGLNIIHRDVKPENILLSDTMHVQVTDFGSAKILGKNSADSKTQRANSFVGTAQYVSPELLTSKTAYKSSDLWALGCIVYQLLSGRPPFHASNEYQIFQKIIKLDYTIPDGFPLLPKDLVQKLLVLEPDKRLGCDEQGGYSLLKDHEFYNGIDWVNLHLTTPPKLLPYLPSNSADDESLRSTYDLSLSSSDEDEQFEDSFLSRFGLTESSSMNRLSLDNKDNNSQSSETATPPQNDHCEWRKFVGDHAIVKTGLIDKRKGLFSKRRQLLLTEGPHLYYVDPQAMELKGEIPWTKDLRSEAKNFKIFFVHTPSRTYYLEDSTGFAIDWVKAINAMHAKYFSA